MTLWSMNTVRTLIFIIPVREIKLHKATHELEREIKTESSRFMNVIKDALSDVQVM
jgi:hypothetical protein